MKIMPADFAHVLRMLCSHMFDFKLLRNFLLAFKLRVQRDLVKLLHARERVQISPIISFKLVSKCYFHDFLHKERKKNEAVALNSQFWFFV